MALLAGLLGGAPASAGEPKDPASVQCGWLDFFPVKREVRSALMTRCRGLSPHKRDQCQPDARARDDALDFLAEVLIAKPDGDTWMFRASKALRDAWRIESPRPPAEAWWGAITAEGGSRTDVAKRLTDTVANSPFDGKKHPLALLFAATKFGDWARASSLDHRCAGGQESQAPDADAFEFVTVRVRSNRENTYWLADGASIPTFVPPVPCKPDLRYLAIPKGTGGILAVYPDLHAVTPSDAPGAQRPSEECLFDPLPRGAAPEEGPPLVYRIDGATARSDRVAVLDTRERRRAINIYVRHDPGERLGLDGYAITPDSSPSEEDTVHAIREVRLTSPPAIASELVLIAANGQRSRIVAHAPLIDSAPHDWKGQTKKTGLLPVTIRGCDAFALDEAQISERIKRLLTSWNEESADLGLSGSVIKAYVEAAHQSPESRDSTQLSKGVLGTKNELEQFESTLYTRGFSDLLDVRVSCSQPHVGDEIYAISAARVSVTGNDLESAEPTSFQNTTEVVTGAGLMNQALSIALARLWDHRAVLMKSPKPELASLDVARAQLELTGMKGTTHIYTEVHRLRDNSDLCDRIQSWNQLRGSSSFASQVRTASLRAYKVPDTSDVPVTYVLDGPGQFVIQASLDRSSSPQSATEQGTRVYGCFRAVMPALVGSVSYFSPSFLASFNRQRSRDPEKTNNWLLLSSLGPTNGPGAALGFSHRSRRGLGPTSWEQTADLQTSTLAGVVGYRVEVWSLYPGITWSERWQFARRWNFDMRASWLLRLDLVDKAGVPASLHGFAERQAGAPIDAAFALTAGIGFQITREISISGTALVALPRATSLFVNESTALQRSIYYDPNFLMIGIGLGAEYAWTR